MKLINKDNKIFSTLEYQKDKYKFYLILLNFAKQIGIDNGCTDMYLTVNEENIGAIKTYEKFGMRVKNIAYMMELNK